MKTLLKFKMVGMFATLIVFGSCGGPSGETELSSKSGQEQIESAENSNDPMKNMGIGPIQNITLGSIDVVMVNEGAKIYTEKCSACHKGEEKFIGPAPKGIMDRRSPEWIMNMILNPEGMIQKDPVARQLLIDYNLAPMANQHLTQEEARKTFEYFRTL